MLATMIRMKTFCIRHADVLTAIGLTLLIGTFLLNLENPVSHDDGLRHFAYARLMTERGIAGVHGWREFLYRGPLSAVDLDPWFLADILYIPFTVFPVEQALHLFTIVSIAIFSASFLVLLRSFSVPPLFRAILLILLVTGDMNFLYRLLLARPFPLMTALVLLSVWAVHKRHFILLGVLMGVAVLFSHLFILSLSILALLCCSFLWTGKMKDGASIAAATILGLLAGFLFHPHRFAYAEYLATIFLKIPFLKNLPISSEMGSGLLTDMVPLMVIGGITAGILLLARKVHSRMPVGILQFLWIVLPLFVAYLLWVRMMDLLWPLLLVLVGAVVARFPETVQRIRSELLPRTWAPTVPIGMLFLLCTLQTGFMGSRLRLRDPYFSLAPYTEVLAAAPAGSRVLNIEWDLFPVYAAVRPDLRYARGIDASFEYFEDPALGAFLTRSRSASLAEDASARQAWIAELLERISADFLMLTHRQHGDLAKALIEKTPKELTLVQSNEIAALFRIAER